MPAPTNYTPSSTFWTSITNALDTTLMTFDILYRLGLNKVADRTEWLRDEIVRQQARLASATAGTRATVIGSANLSTLTYDPTAGSLNGKTFGAESDTNAATITFGTGSGAPSSPADVVTQINAATASDPLATLDAAGHLSLSAVTTGAASSLEVMGGSALAVLGFPVAVVSGVATGNDGASQIGAAQVVGSSFTIPAGNLRAVLQKIADTALAGGTQAAVLEWLGNHTFKKFLIHTTDTGRLVGRPTGLVAQTGTPDSISVIRDWWLLDNPTANKVIVVSETPPALDGEEIHFTVINLAVGRTITLLREDGTTPITFVGATGCTFGSAHFRRTLSVWRLLDFSAQVTSTNTTGTPNNP